MRMTRALTALAVLAAGTSAAVACPVCESETGQQVRDGIFNNEFGGRFLAMVLPFLVVGAIHGGPPRRRVQPTHDGVGRTT